MEKAKIDKKLESETEEISLNDIIANLPGYIYWKNTESEYLGCNKNLAEVSELKNTSDIIGKTDHDFTWGKEQSDSFREDDQEVMKTGKAKITEHELPITNQNDQPMFVRTEKIPLYNKKNEVVGILGVALDITDRKNIERDLELALEKIKRTKDSKAEFLSIVMHEVINPISNISMLIEYIKKSEIIKDESLKESINDIYDQAESARSRLENIGKYLDLEQEGISPKITSCILPIFMKDVLSRFDVNNRVHHILNLEDNVPTQIFLDVDNLFVVLNIIIGNAFRFTAEGYVKITLNSIKKENQNYISIIVEDSGCGIPQLHLQNIFKTFSSDIKQTSIPRHIKPSLGLSIGKKIIDLMNGELLIESVENKGTIVTINVPYQLPQTTLLPNNKMLKILLVEDDQLTVKLMKKMFRELGHEVDVALTGLDAVNMATNNKYDLILMDITLPDIDGSEAMLRIQKATSSNPTIIAVTSHAKDTEYFLEQGFADVLAKPVVHKKLKEYIEKVKFHLEEKDDE